MLDHLHAFLAPDLAVAGTIVAIPMFVAGLAGGFTHCAGMCGPFVFAQVASRLSHIDIDAFGTMARVRVAATLPYHLGRLTTYTVLGAIAGGISDSLKMVTQHAWITPAFMLVSAMLFLAQAIDHPFRLPWLDEKMSRGAAAIMRLLNVSAEGGPGTGVGYGGVTLGKHRRAQLQKLARPAMALNAAILLGLAARSVFS